MAIYHLSAKIVSRGKGRSVVAAAAYRAGQELVSERTGIVYDYSHRKEIAHTEIMAPKGAPEWMLDRHKLWNGVEARENRKDAQLAREVELALPVELHRKDQIELVRGYVQEHFVSRGMLADIAIHADNPENPHAHVLLTLREIGPEGFGNKCREWNKKANLLEWREGWALAINRSLEREGIWARVDHRSHETRGIELTPTNKIGVAPKWAKGHGRDIIQERLERHDRIVRENGDKIFAKPELALEALTHQQAVFSKADVGRWLNRHTADADQFQGCLDRVMASSELVLVGKSEQGEERFSTRAVVEIEQRLLDHARQLRGRKGHGVSEKYVKQAVRSRSMNDDQLGAFRHIVSGENGIAVIQGFAGSGKSYMLGAAREAWESQGCRVYGAALAGKAAQGLEIASGIPSRSLHAWQYAWKEGYARLEAGDVLVIDEAGMVGSRQMEAVLDEARGAGAKVVLVGDTEQLQAIEAGAPMRAIGEEIGQVRLSEIRRQREQWQRDAVRALAMGRAREGIEAFAARKRIHEHDKKQQALEGMVRAWDQHRQKKPEEVQMLLAFRRVDVRELNESARTIRREAGELGRDHKMQVELGERKFATHDRLCFLKNDRGLGVMNGSLGTIEKIRGYEMVVRLDGEEGRTVALDIREYNHLDHGYASTVHKAQGITVDRAQVLASDYFDRHVAYVALSRHRDRVDLHWDRETFRDRKHLDKVLCRERQKEMAIDFAKSEVEARRLHGKFESGIQREAKSPEGERLPVFSREDLEKARMELEQERGREISEGKVRKEPELEKGRAQEDLKRGPLPVISRKEIEKARASLDMEQEKAQARQLDISRQARQTIARYHELEHIVKREPLKQREAFERLPEVREVILERDQVQRSVEALVRSIARFEAAHPLKARTARLGLGRPEIYREAKVAEKRLKKLERKLDGLSKKPKLQREAGRIAQNHNLEIEEAKKELAQREPDYVEAKEQCAQELKMRALELGRQRELGRGRDDDLGL